MKKDLKSKAKLSQLNELSKEMKKMMGDDYAKGLQKVTVASDSPEGLKKGLSKAQEIMEKKGLMKEEMEDKAEEKEMCEACEGEGCEACEEQEEKEEMSPEMIKKQIKELQAKLAEME